MTFLINALLALIARIATEKVAGAILEDVLVFAIKKLVANTTSTLDDEVAATVFDALGRNPDGGKK